MYECDYAWDPEEAKPEVDTTAAGDTFTGYFLANLLAEASIETCLKMAAKAASIAVTREGASVSIPRKEEINL